MQKKDTGVYKYLDCSTAHITFHDNELLSVNDNANDSLLVVPYEYGYWLYAPESALFEPVTHSPAITDILVKAARESCSWIKLDPDGFEHDDLPKYKW